MGLRDEEISWLFIVLFFDVIVLNILILLNLCEIFIELN